MSYRFALEQFEAASDTLATGAERISHRLASAFATNLQSLDPDKDLPAELRPRFRAMASALTRFGGTAVIASIAASGMREPDLVAFAEEIVRMRRELRARVRRR